MEKNSQKSAVILKYVKRRYDGGPEIEAIRSIERKQAVQQLARLIEQEGTHPFETPEASTPALTPPVIRTAEITEVAPTSEPPTRKTKALHALALGPVELCVGMVGMVTAALAIVAFNTLDNGQMLAQGQGLFADCLKTFSKGLLDTATTPVRVLKAVSTKAA